jgi:hypothetical protein
MSHFYFKRPYLAAGYCDSLEGKGIANARSGLFLAGPRRVGKSAFLTEEFVPEAESRDWVTVYVDLWANKAADPAVLIAEAIKTKISHFEKKINKLIKSVKLNKVNILGTFILDFSKSGLPENMTLTDALSLLTKLAEKPVVLIIDEAQHALTTDNGLNAMFAIKSARDQLNKNSEQPSFMLVCTGSSRDKLTHLVLKKDQPFFGSEVTPFPLLNKEFTDFFTTWVNKNLARSNQFAQESMWQAFRSVGHRPEILSHIAGRIALSGEASHFAESLEKEALIWHDRIWEEFAREFNALTLMQQAILEVIIQKGHAWLPFSEESVNCYKKILKQNEISIATVQTSIQTLRERGFIWQSGRGAYSLEDESFAEWFRHFRGA